MNGNQPPTAPASPRTRPRIAALLTIAALSAASTAAVAQTWPCVQHDPQHSGRGDAVATDTAPILRWELDLGGSIFGSPLIGADGTIAVTTGNAGRLWAISANGQPLWSFATRDAALGAPAMQADGSLFVADRSGYLYQLDGNGNLLWEYRNPASEPTTERRFLAPLTPAPAGGVYAADWLHALSWVRDGTAEFTPVDQAFGVWIKDYLSTAVCLDEAGERLFYPLRATHYQRFQVICLDATDGSDLWLFQDLPPLTGPGYNTMQRGGVALDAANDRLFVPASYHDWSGSFLYCLAAADGAALWPEPLDLGSGCYATPALSPAGDALYLPLLDGTLRAIDADSGTPLWSYASGAEMIVGSAAVDAAGKVIFGDMSGVLHCLDAQGNLLWSDAGDGATIAAAVAIAANGDLLCGTTSGRLRRLGGARR
jgi:outer membrane protein assembly factor BamB